MNLPVSPTMPDDQPPVIVFPIWDIRTRRHRHTDNNN